MSRLHTQPTHYVLLALVFVAAPVIGLAPLQARAATLRFVAEFSQADRGQVSPATLDVTFYESRPTADQAEVVLRNCLVAATAAYEGVDITARAWFSKSRSSTNKQSIELTNGSSSLSYNTEAKTVVSGNDANAVGATTKRHTSASDQRAAIAGDSKVAAACKDVRQGRLLTLIGTGLEKRGSERKVIVKAMRTWCKGNDVSLDRTMRLCMSAISKAIIAAGGEAAMSSEELEVAIGRGADAYRIGQCGKCHASNGRGSAKGPDLTDTQWLHCDGSIAGIRQILVSGIPRSRFKDASRPFPMKPATELLSDKKQLTDLAAYVRSLSQK